MLLDFNLALSNGLNKLYFFKSPLFSNPKAFGHMQIKVKEGTTTTTEVTKQ